VIYVTTRKKKQDFLLDIFQIVLRLSKFLKPPSAKRARSVPREPFRGGSKIRGIPVLSYERFDTEMSEIAKRESHIENILTTFAR
jgi:hypothetical protein